MRDSAAVDPDFDAETVETADRDEKRGPSLLLGVTISVAAAVLATALALMLHRRRHTAATSEAASSAPRAGPTSTIAVNWAFALFGSNVMGERPRRSRRVLAIPGRRRQGPG